MPRRRPSPSATVRPRCLTSSRSDPLPRIGKGPRSGPFSFEAAAPRDRSLRKRGREAGMRLPICVRALGLASLALLVAAAAGAQDFYAGKSLTIIVGYAPGGGVDTGARLIARHIGGFIPGRPGVVVQNMPGAAGLVAANHIYAIAQSDGLTLAVPG